MNIAITHIGHTMTVCFSGALDYTTFSLMDGLISELKEVNSDEVRFDLSKVSRVDSVGLGMLFMARDSASEKGATTTMLGTDDKAFLRLAA